MPVIGGRLTIGREEGNHLRIEDPKSSRYHAEVVFEKGHWHVHDLGSSNGTWGPAGRFDSLVLKDGAIFKIGRTQLSFELAGGATPTNPEEPHPGPLVGPRERIEGLAQSDSDRLRRNPGTEASIADLARQNAYLVLLHRIVERSRDCHSRDDVFELLDDAAAEALEGDRCAVFLPAEDQSEGWALWPAHAVRLRARYGAIPFARTLLQAVRHGREPLLCTTDSGDLDPSVSMLQAGVRSAMAAPLRIGEEVHALLYVDRIHGADPFKRDDLAFLAAAANQLAVCCTNLAQVAGLTAELARLQAERSAQAPPALVGSGLDAVRAGIERMAPARVHVALIGEPGCGKDLVARHLHYLSPRREAPYQTVRCAADTGHLLAALFGSSGAPGALELCDGGTVVLEDLSEASPEVQERLVRAIDQGLVQRPGEATPRAADVRLVATLQRPLSAERCLPHLVDRFGFSLTLPPLRERPGDIEALAAHLLVGIAAGLARPAPTIDAVALSTLMRHPWPGNVRQLRQALERAVVAAEGGVIHQADLPDTLRDFQADASVGPIQTLAEVERQYIIQVLERLGGNKKAAAEVLGIDRSTLYAKLKSYGVIDR